MNEFIHLVGSTIIAISGLLIVIAAGAVLNRLNVLTDSILNALGKALVFVMVPVLMFVSMIRFANLSEILSVNWVMAVSVAGIVILGFSLAAAAVRLFGVRQDSVRGVLCATGLPNGAYMPMAMNMMLCASFTQFAGLETQGIAMVAIGMFALTPSIWGVGYSVINGIPLSLRNWRVILTPPIYGMAGGIALGLIMEYFGLHAWFLKAAPTVDNPFPETPVFYSAYQGLKMIADCAIPCALLILGGKLAVKRSPGAIQKRAVTITVITRLVGVPMIVFWIVLGLQRADILPHDPFMTLMIVLISAMPPSNDLVVIASASHRTEGLVANLTFWCYLGSIVTIPVFISLALKFFA